MHLRTQEGFVMEISPGAVMFTGINDKNGRAIYEGDMLEWDEDYDKDCMPDDGRETYKRRGIVVFKTGVFFCDEDDIYGLSMNATNGQNNYVEVVS